ncbi:hypothetical protein HDV00_009404 [Rhizophlyctis rosea]|nr:hypothetical protein HDV00_009404 [Rhizophlyctis rosea]
MTSIPILPDVLALIFAHPSTTVPDLLLCERVCRHWNALIHTHQAHIWKPKLKPCFPSGCLPPRHGEETWRDLACLCWAWRRPWDPSQTQNQGPDIVVKELQKGETMLKKTKSVVRDLVGSYGTTYDTHAIRPSGHILKSKSPRRTPIFIDTLFTETLSTTRANIHHLAWTHHHGTTILVRTGPDLQWEDWDTGIVICSSESLGFTEEDMNAWVASETTCHGSSISLYHVVMSGDELTHNLLLIPNRDPPSRFTFRLPPTFTHLSLNETLLAFLTKDIESNTTTLTLHSTTSKTPAPLYKTTLPQSWSETIRNFIMTRFNIFILAGRHVHIYDLRAGYLHAVTLPGTIPENDFSMEKRNMDWVLVCETVKEGGGGGGGDESGEEGNEKEIWVLDPKWRSRRRVRRGGGEGEGEDNRKEGRDGYFFFTVEYPVDGEGNRTGAAGRYCHYWREM